MTWHLGKEVYKPDEWLSEAVGLEGTRKFIKLLKEEMCFCEEAGEKCKLCKFLDLRGLKGGKNDRNTTKHG